MLGRSDGTLNPNGVRFGSAEIYNIVEPYIEIEDRYIKMGEIFKYEGIFFIKFSLFILWTAENVLGKIQII